jgi:hypothetical protein
MVLEAGLQAIPIDAVWHLREIDGTLFSTTSPRK